MFGSGPEVGLLLHTTNAIESLHRGLRKAVKTRGHFPSDQAAAKLLCLAIRNVETKRTAAPIWWRRALNQLDILFATAYKECCINTNNILSTLYSI